MKLKKVAYCNWIFQQREAMCPGGKRAYQSYSRKNSCVAIEYSKRMEDMGLHRAKPLQQPRAKPLQTKGPPAEPLQLPHAKPLWQHKAEPLQHFPAEEAIHGPSIGEAFQGPGVRLRWTETHHTGWQKTL